MIDAERDVYESTTPTSTAACTTLSHAGRPTPTRRRAARCSASSTRRDASEIVFAARHHRGHQPGGPDLRPAARRRRRRGADHRPRAPLEHRALADAVRGEGRAPAGRADRRRRRDRAGRVRAPARAAHEARRRRPTSRTRSARSTRCARIVELAHAQRRAGAGRRRAGGAAPARSTCGRSTATSTPSPATRCTGPTGIGVLYGKAALLEAMPPWQGGGDMILSVTFEKTTYNELPVQVRGGHAEHRGRASRFGRRARLRRRASASTRIAAHEHDLLAYAHRARCATIPGLRIIGTARGEGRRALLRARGRPPARHRHHPRLRGHRHPHRPPLRAAGDGALRRARPPRAPRFGLYNTRDEIDALVRGLHKVREMFALMSDLRELYQEVILDHSKQAAELPRAARRRPQGRGLQPAVRRPGDGVVRLDGDVVKDVELRGRGLLDLHRLGLDDDRERQGQDAARRRRRCSSASTRSSPAPPAEAPAERRRSSASWRCSPGVCEFPVRVKCASLPWHTLKAALRRRRPTTGFDGVAKRRMTRSTGRRRARDVEVTAIPYGERIPLQAGTRVIITQSLGGSLHRRHRRATWSASTARTRTPSARSAGRGPSRGRPRRASRSTSSSGTSCKTCYDPEIPVNIVELGLVYSCDVDAARRRRQQGRRHVSP